MADTTAVPRGHVKETLTSIIISFALAFVFRGFVVEAFLIPTGSMAPTLMGQHIRLRDEKNGYSWPVGPRDMLDFNTPAPQQGGPSNPIRTVDPLTRERLPDIMGVPRRAGDRIFVMKYLYSIYDPQRFDVVVFKNPTDPSVNYIKRLVGLPGEQTALIDGDVFTRTPRPGDTGDNPWLLAGWSIARKPERAQRTLWQLVFSSEYTPKLASDVKAFKSPWVFQGEGWSQPVRGEYACAGTKSTSLRWDAASRPIRDFYAYDEGTPGSVKNDNFPVSDLRVSLGIKPEREGQGLAGIVTARGHEFRAEIDGRAVTLRMRPLPTPGGSAEPAWTTLGSGTLAAPVPAGTVTNVEFWHVDQSLQVWIGDERVAYGAYDWSPDERLRSATTMGAGWSEEVMRYPDQLYVVNRYIAPEVRLEFSGGAFSLYRVALWRDVHYQPDRHPTQRVPGGGPLPALATHPSTTLSTTPDQFFVCGDNSPASLDARLWDNPDPWVAELDPTRGVVHRDLLIGKAFFVYFPAPWWRGSLPVPDFGRMRFIW